MAAATAMDMHDRRLAISKSSSSKISKQSSVIKRAAPSSSPPPSSHAASRPVAKVVNADPSSFRRVVQELTGTTPTSTTTLASSSSSSPQVNASIARPSRLQRIAPPPLRPDFRNLQPQHPQQEQQYLLQQHQQHQQDLLQQQQQQQQVSHYLLLQQQQQQRQHMQNDLLKQQQQQQQQQQYQLPMVGPFSPPPLHFTQFGNPNPNFPPSLPMLSPHLLSPLPALTPGDNTWANPMDSIPTPSPKPLPNPTLMSTRANSMPPLLPLPTMSGEFLGNGHGHGQPLARPPMGMSSSYGQPLPPLLANPPSPLPFSPTSRFNWLAPWSPPPFLSPPSFSPGFFPPSPGLGPFHYTGPNSNTDMKLTSPKDFTFRGPNDHPFRPS